MLSRQLLCFAAVIFATTNLMASPPDIRNADELRGFVDGVMESSMRNNHVVGAVAVIMVDDQVLVSKGYGYANLESKTPVDPQKTLFRIGSVSKLFTYTALMQLAEQGKIDLDANIQDYLPNLNIPNTFDEPIRVKNLFSHTAGFDERLIGLFSRNAEDAIAYETLLAKELPDRVRKPGEVSQYSNHSLGIAGLIIENVSGMQWADYVQTYLLDPLDMNYATAHQPIPSDLASHASTGYRWTGSEHKPEAFEIIPLGSAGTMSASGVAMTKFMLANLHAGSYGDQQILSQDSIRQLHSPLHQVHDAIDFMAYGFIHETTNGLNILSHTGGTTTYFTYWGILPEENIGIFISTNTTGGGQVMNDLRRGLFDHYFPHEPSVTPAKELTDLNAIAGDYVSYRHPRDSGVKLFMYMFGRYSIVPVEPGVIRILSASGLPPKTAIETSKGIFQITDEDKRIYFDTDAYGQRRMFYGHALDSYFKLGLIDAIGMHLTLMFVSLAVFTWILIAWPVQRVRDGRLSSEAEHRSRLSFWLLSLTTLITVLLLVLNSSEEIVFGLRPVMVFALNLAYLVPLLTLISLYFVVRLVQDFETSRQTKVFHGCIAGLAVISSWQFYFWQFLGT